MNITEADRALAAGFAGAPQDLALQPALPYFDITGIDANGLKHEVCEQATDGFAAGNKYIALGWAPVSARPHPQELTYEDGRARFPKALRRDAFMDAWRGWEDAKAEARAALPAGVKQAIRSAEHSLQIEHDWAFVAQLGNPDPIEQAHRAAQGV